MSGRRVLELLGPSTGGIRRHVAFLTGALRERGWDVTLAGPAGVLDDLDAVVPIPAGIGPVALWRARSAVAALAGGVDLVHAHGLKPAWLASTIRGRPPLVATVHNVVLDEAAGRAAPVLRALERRLPPRVDHLIAVSADIAAHLAGRGVSVIAAAADPPPRPSRSPEEVRAAYGVAVDAPLVVAAARLHPQKGLDVLLAALPAVRDAVPEVHVIVAGDGPARVKLEQQADRSGLTGTVVFVGHRDPVADELAAADVVVFASRWEGSPLTVTEALTLGSAVVATPVGTIPELVVDGETGWIVPVGDDQALAAALVEALLDPGERRRRAAAGQQRARELVDPDALVSRVEDVYRATLVRR